MVEPIPTCIKCSKSWAAHALIRTSLWCVWGRTEKGTPSGDVKADFGAQRFDLLAVDAAYQAMGKKLPPDLRSQIGALR
jgi:hypothetical protein